MKNIDFVNILAGQVYKIDFDRNLGFLDDCDLICDLSSASLQIAGEEKTQFQPRVGDRISGKFKILKGLWNNNIFQVKLHLFQVPLSKNKSHKIDMRKFDFTFWAWEVPQQPITDDKIVHEIRPAESNQRTGTVSFWDKKREYGRINRNIAFNISDCSGWTPRNNDEVIFYEIPNRKVKPRFKILYDKAFFTK